MYHGIKQILRCQIDYGTGGYNERWDAWMNELLRAGWILLSADSYLQVDKHITVYLFGAQTEGLPIPKQPDLRLPSME